jgi:hypothetical protein
VFASFFLFFFKWAICPERLIPVFQVIIALLSMAALALGAIFALPSTPPSLMPKPGTDEVGWTCSACGATNYGNICQMCLN